MGFFDNLVKKEKPAANNSQATGVSQGAPNGAINLKKTAGISLQKHNLAGVKAAVYLVLDHSGSMRKYYKDRTVQDFAEKVLAVGANLDDDGDVPIILFDSYAREPFIANLEKSEGVIDLVLKEAGHMGTTSYVDAIEAVVKDYENSGSTEPALVIFQTDGSPDSRAKAEKALCEASTLPIFWQFVGFGNDSFDFLRKLDELPENKRAVDNAGFFAAGNDPKNIPTENLYDKILQEFPEWIRSAKAKGIIK